MRRLFFCLTYFVCLSSLAQSYLVLPFENGSSQRGWDWIGESAAESISTALSAEGFIVSTREERREALVRLQVRPGARLTLATSLKLAQSIDATAVVLGQLREAAGGLEISGQVVDVRQLTELGAFTVRGSLNDLERLEGQAAWRTLRAVAPAQTPDEAGYLSRRSPVRVDAKELFIRGLLSEDPMARIRGWMQAARLEPSYAAAVFELGKLYLERKQWQEAALWLGRVPPENARSREAAFLNGIACYRMEDYQNAEKAFAHVAAQVPVDEVFNNLAAAQLQLGQPEAMTNMRRTLEGGSSDADYHFNLGFAHYRAAEYAKGAEEFRSTLERAPEDKEATEMLGRCLKPSSARPAIVPRLKTAYPEAAFRQLQAVLAGKK